MKRVLFQKTSLCSGCLSCQTACSTVQCGAYHPESSCIRIELQPFTGNHTAEICMQCSSALCAEHCPTKAIKFQGTKKYWYIDYDLCITCRTCMSKCPFGGVFYDEIHDKVIKCDTCNGKYRCVEACKFGVLEKGNDNDRKP